MARQTFPNTVEGRAAANAVASPKHIIERLSDWGVLTGTDMPESVVTREITTEEFRDRFTAAELLAVVSSDDAAIKYALLKLSIKAIPMIDLDNQEVVATVGRLVTLGLITAPRATAILSS